MKITKLTLHKNLRLHLLKEETFVLAPSSQHIVIRGVSGLGKSTIIYELSPLPAHMSGYGEGGYKEIELEYKGRQYVLMSMGKGAGTHSFVVDGNELNEGGTRTVQLQLVQEHFNYTPKLHDVMIGHTRFTRMSGNERRNWFAQMSNTDTEFVNKLWDTIKSNQRDKVGALKDNAANLVDYQTRMTNEETMAQLKEELSYLEDRRNKATELLGQCKQGYDGRYGDDADFLLDELVRFVSDLQLSAEKQWAHYHQHYKVHGFDSATQVLQELQQVTLQKTNLDLQRIKLHQQIEETQTELHTYQFEENLNLEDIEKMRQQFDKKYQQFKQQPFYERIVSQYQSFSSRLPDDRLRYILDALINHDQQEIATAHELITYSQDIQGNAHQFYRETQEKMKQLEHCQSQLQRLDDIIPHMEQHIKSMEGDEPLTCPQCNHQYRYIKDEDKYKHIKEKQQHAKKKKIEIEQQRDRLTSEIEERKPLTQVYEHLSRLVFSDISRLQRYLVLFGYLDQDTNQSNWGRYAENRIELNNIFFKLSEQAKQLIAYLDLLQEKHVLEDLERKGLSQTSPAYIKLVVTAKQQQEEEQQLHQELDTLEARLTILTKANQSYLQAEASYREFEKRYLETMTLYEDYTLDNVRRTLEQIIVRLTAAISDKQQVLQNQSGLRLLVSHLENAQTGLNRDIKLYDRVMAILNPKDGLIAKSMIGFIRAFVDEMNQYISHVWTYSFVINIEDNEDFTKDYNFPVRIGDRTTHQSKDVFLTSTGQSEMIDLAFKLTMAKYFDLQQWPIYADELGGTLNVTHRNNLYALLKRLTDEGISLQLFVVTHLDDIEATMDPSELIELHTTG